MKPKIRNRKSEIQKWGNPSHRRGQRDGCDMLYATKFWAPDLHFSGAQWQAHAGLERFGNRSRRKQADADEFVMFRRAREREVQGKSKNAPPYEKVLSHFLKKTRRKIRSRSRSFRFAMRKSLAASKIRVRATKRILLAGAGGQI